MSRPLLITVAGHDRASTADLRSLRRWLTDVDELRGRVDLRQPPPASGELGAVADVLMVALGSGGAAGALVSALTSWIRHRTTDLDLIVTRPDGTTIEVSGRRLRALDASQLSGAIERLAELMAGPAEDRPGELEQRTG